MSTEVVNWIVTGILSTGGLTLIGVIVKGLFDRNTSNKTHELSSTEATFKRQEAEITRLTNEASDLRRRLDAVEHRLDQEQDYNQRLVSHILSDTPGPPPPPRSLGV